MSVSTIQSGESGLAGAFTQNRADLLRFLASRCGSRERAEDYLHDLWIKLAQTPTGPVSNPRAYLFRMANNLVLDAARAQQRSQRRDRAWLEEMDVASAVEDRIDPADSPEVAIARQQEAEVLRGAIGALPDGARRALILYRFDGLGQAEIARVLGISRSGVEKHLALAMRRLRDSLADCGLFNSGASEGKAPARGGEARMEQDQ